MSTPNMDWNRRILIIDDNPSIHEDFRKILLGAAAPSSSSGLDTVEEQLFGDTPRKSERSGFEIDSAYQGKEGLDMVRAAMDANNPYAMAFVDVRMPPGWDGIETITQIWKSCPDLQVVVCTAYSDYSWQDILEKVGDSDSLVVLKKPFDMVEVLQLAHALTKKWFLNQQALCKFNDLDKLVLQRTGELEQANQKLRIEIQERTQAEEALRLSEERFEKAFCASPIPMAIYTAKEERYLDLNEACLKMISYRREEVIGFTRGELDIYAKPQQGEEVTNLLRGLKSLRNFPSQIRTRSGNVREVLLSGELLELQVEVCVLVLVEDVTERLSMENQLRQSQKMEAIGQLASGVAHDFNNLLTIIQGHIALRLATKRFDEETTASLEEVGQAAERAAELTRQLLAFSRKQVINRRVQDINEAIIQSTKMLERLLGAHIRLKCHFGQDLPKILADPGSLAQVLMNLAVNARDAMADGGELTIATSPAVFTPEAVHANPEAHSGSFVRLTVSDTGSGIKPEILSRIFEPFFTTKGVGKGTGLGLSTIHGIMQQHKGWIDVSSEVGKGSSFHVYFPVTDQLPADQTPENRTLARAAITSSILVVEDEPLLRKLATTILNENGYATFEAGNGPEALKVWGDHESEIELLLTDLVMPEGITGTQLADRLRQIRPHLKVLFMSGYSPETVGTNFATKNLHFLPKPFVPAALLKAVTNCLHKS